MTGIVKICGLTDAATVDAALDAGADLIGFVFFPRSPRNLAPAAAAALAERARGRAQIVALTVDADDALLAAIVAALEPDLLQLHGRESPARVRAIAAACRRQTIKAIGVAAHGDLGAAAPYETAADHLLIDAKPPKTAVLPGGNGVAFDWRLTHGFAPACPWLLSGGLDPGNVAEAIAASGARGVDVSSGVESAPGVKDTEKLRAFVAAARRAFAGTPEEVG